MKSTKITSLILIALSSVLFTSCSKNLSSDLNTKVSFANEEAEKAFKATDKELESIICEEGLEAKKSEIAAQIAQQAPVEFVYDSVLSQELEGLKQEITEIEKRIADDETDSDSNPSQQDQDTLADLQLDLVNLQEKLEATKTEAPVRMSDDEIAVIIKEELAKITSAACDQSCKISEKSRIHIRTVISEDKTAHYVTEKIEVYDTKTQKVLVTMTVDEFTNSLEREVKMQEAKDLIKNS